MKNPIKSYKEYQDKKKAEQKLESKTWLNTEINESKNNVIREVQAKAKYMNAQGFSKKNIKRIKSQMMDRLNDDAKEDLANVEAVIQEKIRDPINAIFESNDRSPEKKSDRRVRFKEDVEESVSFDKEDSPDSIIEEREAIIGSDDGLEADLAEIRGLGSRGDIFMDQSDHAQHLNEQTAEKQEQFKGDLENSGPGVENTEPSGPRM